MLTACILVSSEVRRQHQTLWKWNYRRLWEIMFVLETEPRSSERASSTLQHWAIFLGSLFSKLFFFKLNVFVEPWECGYQNITFSWFSPSTTQVTEYAFLSSGLVPAAFTKWAPLLVLFQYMEMNLGPDDFKIISKCWNRDGKDNRKDSKGRN